MNEILFISVWFLCGLIGSGFMFADFQGRFPLIAKENFRSDLGSAILFSIFGIITLLVGFFMSGFGKYGCRLWRKRNE